MPNNLTDNLTEEQKQRSLHLLMNSPLCDYSSTSSYVDTRIYKTIMDSKALAIKRTESSVSGVSENKSYKKFSKGRVATVDVSASKIENFSRRLKEEYKYLRLDYRLSRSDLTKERLSKIELFLGKIRGNKPSENTSSIKPELSKLIKGIDQHEGIGSLVNFALFFILGIVLYIAAAAIKSKIIGYKTFSLFGTQTGKIARDLRDAYAEYGKVKFPKKPKGMIPLPPSAPNKAEPVTERSPDASPAKPPVTPARDDHPSVLGGVLESKSSGSSPSSEQGRDDFVSMYRNTMVAKNCHNPKSKAAKRRAAEVLSIPTLPKP